MVKIMYKRIELHLLRSKTKLIRQQQTTKQLPTCLWTNLSKTFETLRIIEIGLKLDKFLTSSFSQYNLGSFEYFVKNATSNAQVN